MLMMTPVNASPAAPIISNVQISPSSPRIQQAITVTATVSDPDDDLDSVTLHYRVFTGGYGGEWAEIDMTQTGDTWKATIPAQSMECEIEYYVEAIDKAGETGRSVTTKVKVTAGMMGGGLSALLPIIAIVALIAAGVVIIVFITKRR